MFLTKELMAGVVEATVGNTTGTSPTSMESTAEAGNPTVGFAFRVSIGTLEFTDGKSRQFAFIGFRTEQEAEEAIKYFNRSFLDTCRLTCEIAHKVGDPNMPRPWSRHSLKKEKKVTEDEKNLTGAEKGGKKILEKGSENDDPQLQEFLQVMQPRVKSKMWANDTLIGSAANHNAKVSQGKTLADEEGDEKLAALHSNKTHRVMIVLMTATVRMIMTDDGDFIKREHDSQSEVEEDVNGEILDPVNPSSRMKDEQDEVFDSGRLFVRNLPYTTTGDELRELFSKYGNVSEVHIVVDKDTKRSKGIAYILYTLPESTSRAIDGLDNSTFQGRLLHVMPARHKNSSQKQDQGSKTLKQRREEERKAAEASGDTKAWNSLFMRSDTVVENIARKHGVSKSDLLDREADDLAVRMALGETQVIADTKKALSNAGINVSSLEDFAAGKTKGTKRSNHVFTVKNLPYDSSEGELAKMFGKFGSLDEVILPTTRTLALVVFLEPAEASAAFKGLAYKRYKYVVLFLLVTQLLIIHFYILFIALFSSMFRSRSLFVKNLNFKTSDENLRKHFSEHVKEGSIISVRVKKYLKNGKNVSMGFGFIEFDSMETAGNVCRDLQGIILDGHALIVQLCHAKKDEQVVKKVGKDKSSTKLLVKNVAFEATEKDLRQLFSPFGQIKSLRLPMKFGNHRGFAFVEFVTKQEAQNALEALSNTHLYGRHLVLERAKEGESLEELRARTAAQFSEEQTGFQNSSKLSKKRKHMAILDEGTMKFERIADC
ncbi:hypothetical protein EZV62_007617 [Acer yangbiense]|uniref:RRM domain-containing protein n=1 Tax=Acer yangbiense TaxID=1000413 RepID=A0A5C7IC32_9ROSI|nr:hypothetical protein EZV62_007617 [Acer yangbiense]